MALTHTFEVLNITAFTIGIRTLYACETSPQANKTQVKILNPFIHVCSSRPINTTAASLTNFSADAKQFKQMWKVPATINNSSHTA